MSPKPPIQLRKPTRPDPEAIERFVHQSALPDDTQPPAPLQLRPSPNVQTFERPDVQTSERSDVQPDTTERRRTTIYFQPDTARALKLHAATHGLQMSDLVEEAVRHWLTHR